MRYIIHTIVLLAIVMAGFFANDLLVLIGGSPDTQVAHQYCYLSSQACQQDGVDLQLAEDRTHPMQANHLTVIWPDQNKEMLMLTLRGLEMDMGIVKIPLKLAKNGTYQADLILPVCTQSQMTWIGELTDGSLTVFPAIRSDQ